LAGLFFAQPPRPNKINPLRATGPNQRPQPRNLSRPRSTPAIERECEALAQLDQVGLEAVMAGNHRQAGECAFAGLALRDQRRAPRAAQLQQFRAHAVRREIAWSGLSSQSRKPWRSRMMVASRAMPGWSPIFSP